MEVDRPVPTPDKSILASLGLIEEISSVVKSGLDERVRLVVIRLCNEIQELYGIKEGVSGDGGLEDPSFLYELSSFLSELECPYEEITCGPIEDRYATVDRCLLLLVFLTNEIKTARLFALNELKNPISHDESVNPVTTYLACAFSCVHEPTTSSNSVDLLNSLNNGVIRQLDKCRQRPLPLFKCADMDSKRWMAIEKVVAALIQDCRSRNILLLKRIDVAVSSFLWADKVKKNEKHIKDIFDSMRPKIADPVMSDVAALLSASEMLLAEIGLTSRKVSKAHVIPLLKSEQPPDRGGRTGEMPKIAKETFYQQGRGRGGGGRGNRDHRGQQQHRGSHQGGSAEQQVRNEYSDRTHGSGYNRGSDGNQGGYGNQRGGGYQGGRGNQRGRGHRGNIY